LTVRARDHPAADAAWIATSNIWRGTTSFIFVHSSTPRDTRWSRWRDDRHRVDALAVDQDVEPDQIRRR